MPFPVMIPMGPWRVHPHLLFESLGYFGGARLYFFLKRRQPDGIPGESRWGILAGAALGAALGAHLLHGLNELPRAMSGQWPYSQVLIGKTIVGGLLGGWCGVETAKRLLGERRSSGDLFVLPLLFAISLGRVGCFLTGLSDFTCGLPTRLPWAVDFGDGIPRHPAQLYEIAALAAFAALAPWMRRRLKRPGDFFRVFLAFYLLLRLLLDALKPDLPLALGLSGIQWGCLAGLAVLVPDIRRILLPSPESAPKAP